ELPRLRPVTRTFELGYNRTLQLSSNISASHNLSYVKYLADLESTTEGAACSTVFDVAATAIPANSATTRKPDGLLDLADAARLLLKGDQWSDWMLSAFLATSPNDYVEFRMFTNQRQLRGRSEPAHTLDRVRKRPAKRKPARKFLPIMVS
ncbi:hypothetical protein, partial [Ralstonia pseudosolanacearum]|uniref:hypothetical protein n=1 Tax=Ralstonia pseudosolanacearum TaxID=1310165 RepID=UPI003CF9DDAC